jgi:hypothetical protein
MFDRYDRQADVYVRYTPETKSTYSKEYGPQPGDPWELEVISVFPIDEGVDTSQLDLSPENLVGYLDLEEDDNY